LKERLWGLAFYAFVSVIISLSSGMLQSHARYVMVIFPVFWAFALLKSARLEQTMRAAFPVLLGFDDRAFRRALQHRHVLNSFYENRLFQSLKSAVFRHQ
jgi:hypothetical protein